MLSRNGAWCIFHKIRYSQITLFIPKLFRLNFTLSKCRWYLTRIYTYEFAFQMLLYGGGFLLSSFYPLQVKIYFSNFKILDYGCFCFISFNNFATDSECFKWNIETLFRWYFIRISFDILIFDINNRSSYRITKFLSYLWVVSCLKYTIILLMIPNLITQGISRISLVYNIQPFAIPLLIPVLFDHWKGFSLNM